jgi:hypothetical protein
MAEIHWQIVFLGDQPEGLKLYAIDAPTRNVDDLDDNDINDGWTMTRIKTGTFLECCQWLTNLAKIEYTHDDGAAWDLDSIQFPRLLCEIAATQPSFNHAAVCEEMDITPAELNELFDRAWKAWETWKNL